MEKVILSKQIANRLRGFAGETVEEKIVYLTERTASANLRECNERISRFEACYGMAFSLFKSAWARGKIPNKHAYATETDFIEWEALEQEKEHWLSVIRSHNAARPKKKADGKSDRARALSEATNFERTARNETHR
ncbi:MAG: hypothetical protein HY327_00190 [Chloroflexi bacterium]|nr:hypothetical protein [Chloroflexota bacterium]